MPPPSQLPLYAEPFRSHDPDRYLAALLAPKEQFGPALALGALAYELAHIREAAKEPMIGLIRLTWWREALADLADHTPLSHPHPVLEALAPWREGLTPAALAPLLDAHERDMEPEPFAAWLDLARYAADTAGTLARLQASLSGLPEDACDIAARWASGWQMLSLIRRAPALARQGWHILPEKHPTGWNQISTDAALALAEPLLARAQTLPRRARRAMRPFALLRRFAQGYAQEIHRNSTASHFDPIARRPLKQVLWAVYEGVTF